ncbi:MAG: HAMP domain-containing sensor histidine kinase [Bacteroidota bacterium]
MEKLTDKQKLEEELRRVNQKLLSAEKVQSDFLSNIKNEINNPLTSIMGLLKVVNDNPRDHQGNIEINKLVYKEVYNLNFQMRNILTAAEIEAGQTSPNISKFNVSELINEVCQAFVSIDSSKEDVLTVVASGELDFTTDKEKLSIIVTNLVSNALKFNKPNEKVMITAEQESENKLILSIRDFGVGIDEDSLKTIFDRFKQLDSGTRKEFGGHGLGLSVVHALVSMLNGDFSVHSIRFLYCYLPHR